MYALIIVVKEANKDMCSHWAFEIHEMWLKVT